MVFALRIPEILEEITKHVTKKEYVACSQVSREWQACFQPAIWRTTDVLVHAKSNPSAEAMANNATIIRYLRFSGLVSLDHFNVGCTQLRLLSIDSSVSTDPTTNDKIAASITRLIEGNPGLQHFIFWGQKAMPTKSIWHALAQCKNISSLQLSRCTLRADDMTSLLQAFTKLESLHILDCDFSIGDEEDYVDLPSDLEFKRLQVLWMINANGWQAHQQLQLAGRAPYLTTLHWRLDRSRKFPEADFWALMSSRSCKSIVELNLYHDELLDKHLALAVSSIGSATSVVAQGTHFGIKAVKSLQSYGHCLTIRKLDLYRCYAVDGEMVQTLLSSCPKLETFAADVLRGVDVVRGAPWVCLGLKSLTIHFDLDGTILEDDRSSFTKAEARTREQKAVCEQLGRLVWIQRLHLCRSTSRTASRQSLDFRLRAKGGILEDLKGLCKLQYLNFHDTEQAMDVEDQSWMFENWPSLLFIMGQYNPTRIIQDHLMQKYLKRRMDIVAIQGRA
ncbi:hypothetical protein BGZ94_006749 [Podila epigama]|nr:hypothetical protein BGZ94_006749 [Podila epigama]